MHKAQDRFASFEKEDFVGVCDEVVFSAEMFDFAHGRSLVDKVPGLYVGIA